MKPASFDYFRPTELAEALSLLTEFGDEARLLSGGQSLIPMMNLRLATPANLIDLSAIPDLAGISNNGTHIRIGAMTRQRELLDDHTFLKNTPLIAQAARNIGHIQTRSRGTVGGSLANADPAAELSLTMVTLDATIELTSSEGKRLIKAREFFVDAMTTSSAANEILTAAIIPNPDHRPKSAFKEFSRRHGDFAVASVAVQRCPVTEELSIGVGAVGTTPRYCARLSALLSAGMPRPDRILEAMEQDLDGCTLQSGTGASANYRKTLAIDLLLACLNEVSAQ